MRDFRPSDNGRERAAPGASGPGAREVLLVFTAGWLGGAGLLTAFAPGLDYAVRLLAWAEAIAAGLWFFPRLRMAGLGAMLAVLAAALLRDLAVGDRPGAVIFYAAVVIYLAVEERRARQA